MKVSIVGAAGKMGSWFASYFVRNGFVVSAYDVKPIPIVGVTSAQSLGDCLKDADLVLLSVPVQKTAELIEKCTFGMKQGSRLAEISSVKNKTLPALRRIRKDLSVLCLHPMFGPGADDARDLKMLMIPVRNRKDEYGAARLLFPNMSINIIKDAKTHDKSIAAVLGLTYFVNVTFADLISKEDLGELKKVGGTTFGVQTILAESVMNDEPELAAALLRHNPYAQSYIVRYLTGARRLARTRKIESSLQNIKANMQEKANLQESYNRLYRMLRGGKIT